MSTRSTIFLTDDNEHCYDDCSEPHYIKVDGENQFLGNTITLEMSKRNIKIAHNDEDYLVIEIAPGSELYDIIESLRSYDNKERKKIILL